ncbi:MAG: thymidine phosphorylase, partial [Candidatus Marinimicrobia bacterium]|nr:thymidine phosphorylase [Candidatus Neomarinimicrobiota bacterium]
VNGLVLDIKTGNGAFISDYDASVHLADQLKHFGEAYGLSVRPVITDMNQPLGNMVGNWLEVRESLDVLKGEGPESVREISLTLTGQMLSLADPERSQDEIRAELERLLDRGDAYRAFLKIAGTQGADIRFLEEPERYPSSAHRIEVRSPREGTISAIDTYQLGLDAIALGAGRKMITDKIDPKAGLELHRHIGDRVEPGEPLVTLYTDNKTAADLLADRLGDRFSFADTPTPKPPYIHEIR